MLKVEVSHTKYNGTSLTQSNEGRRTVVHRFFLIRWQLESEIDLQSA